MKLFHRNLIITGLLVILTGCSGAPKQDATLGSLKNQSIEIEENTSIEQGVEAAIAAYEKLIQSAGDSALSAKALRRLGDLEMQRIDIMYERNEGSQVDASSYDKAIDWYQKLLTRFPNYADREIVLYQLARAYEQGGHIDKSLKALKILIRDYPTSPRAEESSFRRGEILFRNERYREAEADYADIVARGRNGNYYEQGLFKYAWSIYKQDRCLDSLDIFFSILDEKLAFNLTPSELAVKKLDTQSDQELVNDSFRAINLCFSLNDGAKGLERYLANKPHRLYEFMVYEKLAELYIKQKRSRDAAETFSAFAKRAVWHQYAVLWQHKAIEIYTQNAIIDDIIPAKKDYVERYETLYKYWEDNPHNNYFEFLVRSDKQASEEIKAHLKTHLVDIAEYHHAKAQKTDALVDFQEAVRWYYRYLNYFPDGEDAHKINFLLAEALFQDKLYKEAAIQFERTAYDYGDHAKAAEAGYAALIAYTEQEKLLKGGDKDVWHESALQSSLNFAKVFRNDPRAAEVLANAADELYQGQRYDDAMKAAQTILDRYPNSSLKIKRTALIVLANTQFELTNFEIAELLYLELQSVITDKDPLASDIEERLATCIYKQAEHFRAQGAIGSAINEFKRLIVAAPKSSIRPLAEYDIASTYVILDEWDSALEHLQAFKKRYPDHKLIDSVDEKIALAYLRQAKPLEAASALEGIARNLDSPESQREALLQVAALYEEGGELHKAAVNYANYSEKFPTPLEPAVEAMYKAGVLYLKLGRDYYYRIQLEKIINANAKGGDQSSDRTRYLAAKSAFELAEPHYQRYANVQLVTPIRKNMQLKNQLMKQALEAYNKAAEIGVAAFTTAASYRIADMYADFSRKLMDSERPDNLNDEELEQYEILLEEQAFPFEEKAIGLHQGNVARIRDGLYDEWIKKSLTALSELMPARYLRSEKYDIPATTLD